MFVAKKWQKTTKLLGGRGRCLGELGDFEVFAHLVERLVHIRGGEAGTGGGDDDSADLGVVAGRDFHVLDAVELGQSGHDLLLARGADQPGDLPFVVAGGLGLHGESDGHGRKSDKGAEQVHAAIKGLMCGCQSAVC